MSRRRRARQLLASGFAVSGVVHLVHPAVFEPIMPRALPEELHRPLIVVSGLAELLGAVGLARRARWASWYATALLAAVFPANVQMAMDAGTGRHAGGADRRSVAWGRLPLQAVMVWCAWQDRAGEDPSAA